MGVFPIFYLNFLLNDNFHIIYTNYNILVQELLWRRVFLNDNILFHLKILYYFMPNINTFEQKIYIIFPHLYIKYCKSLKKKTEFRFLLEKNPF